MQPPPLCCFGQTPFISPWIRTSPFQGLFVEKFSEVSNQNTLVSLIFWKKYSYNNWVSVQIWHEMDCSNTLKRKFSDFLKIKKSGGILTIPPQIRLLTLLYFRHEDMGKEDPHQGEFRRWWGYKVDQFKKGSQHCPPNCYICWYKLKTTAIKIWSYFDKV